MAISLPFPTKLHGESGMNMSTIEKDEFRRDRRMTGGAREKEQ